MAVALPPLSGGTPIPSMKEVKAAMDVIDVHAPDLAKELRRQWNEAANQADEEKLDELSLKLVRTASALVPAAVPDEPPAVPAPPAPAKARSKAPAAERKADTSSRTKKRSWRALGIAAIAASLLLWVPGSRYALDGWTLAINVVLEIAQSGVVLPLATGLAALLLIPVGLVYSFAEKNVVPYERQTLPDGQRKLIFYGWAALFAWAIVHGTDLVATWKGFTTLGADAWPITRWAATTLWASIVWSVVLTYLPEMLFIAGWKWIGLPWPIWPWKRS